LQHVLANRKKTLVRDARKYKWSRDGILDSRIRPRSIASNKQWTSC